MADSNERDRRYYVQPGKAEEVELQPDERLEAYRLDGDHFVKISITAAKRSSVDISSMLLDDAIIATRKATFGRAEATQVLRQLSDIYDTSGFAVYRPGLDHIQLAISPRGNVEAFRFEVNATTRVPGSSAHDAVPPPGSVG